MALNRPTIKTSLNWTALKTGDVVDVIAPGFCPTDDEVEAGVEFLERWGLVPRLPHDLFGQDVISSNSDAKRLKHLSHALLAKDSSAVWCLRGGYGAIRLVPGLLKTKRPRVCKILLGMSDVTSIQIFLSQVWNWPSLQAPLLDRLGRTINSSLISEARPRPLDAQVEELRRVVFGETSTVLFEGLREHSGVNLPSKRTVAVRGRMSGGNLTTYVSAIGTKLHPSSSGEILYFEDLGERGYRVDRMLEQMIQSGVLSSKTKAIVFGEFLAGLESDGASKVHDVIDRFASTWAAKNKVTVWTGLPSGHGQNQRPVPIGTEAVIDLRSGSLEIDTAVKH